MARVTVNGRTGEIGRAGDSSGAQMPDISGDGKFVVFHSDHYNLQNDDPDGLVPSFSDIDVYVHGLQTGQTELVSLAIDNEYWQANGARAQINHDGRYIVYESYSDNLVANDNNRDSDVFLYDRQTSETQAISVAGSGRLASGLEASISGDGRLVAFVSHDPNIVAGDSNDKRDVFVRDWQNNTTVRVSVSSTGEQADEGSTYPIISADGRYIVFLSGASNLVPDDTNNGPDLFVRDLEKGETQRVNITSAGSEGPYLGYLRHFSISGNGRFVTFVATDSYTQGESCVCSDVYIRDLETQQTKRVSTQSDGSEIPVFSRATQNAISDDGRYVTFYTDSDIDDPTTPGFQVYKKDTLTGELTRLDEGNGRDPAISANGEFVAFAVQSDDYTEGHQIFVHTPIPVMDQDGDDINDSVETNADSDRDGVANLADLDSDNNTIPDALETNRAFTPADFDADGIANFVDLDDDNDGIPDRFEIGVFGNYQNTDDGARDSDEDLLSNFLEYQKGADPLGQDSDYDKALDGEDNCPIFTNVYQDDIDEDGHGDVCDRDTRRLAQSGGDLMIQDYHEGRIETRVLTLDSSTERQVQFLSDQWSVKSHLAFDNKLLVAAQNDQSGVHIVQVRDRETESVVQNLFPWNKDWRVLDTDLIWGVLPTGAPVVATLARRLDTRLNAVELRDSSDGQIVGLIYPLGRYWDVHSMAGLDTGGKSAIAFLGTRNFSDLLTVIQIRDALSGELITNVFPLGFGWSPLEMHVIDDLNGNGSDEVAVRMSRDTDGLMIIQIRDSLTNDLVSNVYPIGAGLSHWRIRAFTTINVPGQQRLAIMGERSGDGQVLVQIKTIDTGTVVRNLFFAGPPWTIAQGFQVFPDLTGNGYDEIVVMLRNTETGAHLLQIRDTDKGELIRNVPLR